MRHLSPEEFHEQVQSAAKSLCWRVDWYQDHPDELETAASFAIRNGLTIEQLLALAFRIGLSELYRIDSNQREILEGLGRGPTTYQGDNDDLPF